MMYYWNFIFIYINLNYIFLISKVCLKSILFKFESLRDLVAIDFFYKKKRFTLIYNFLSYVYNFTVCFGINIKITSYLPYTRGIMSLSFLFKSANWLEREVWDLFGIFFINHSDFRRLLTDYGFFGFPLRKEYPLIGYKEVRYDDFNNVIYTENVQIMQNYRIYEYTNTFFN